MTTSALDNVLAGAQAAAASKAVAMMEAPATAVAARPTTGLAKPGSNAELMNSGGIDVDAYLKVDKAGLRLGDTFKGFVDEIQVEIDLSEVVNIYQCRAEQPGSGAIQYLKSYDGVATSDGKNFLAEVHRFETSYLKSTGIYTTSEIPMTLLDDIKDPKSATVLEQGTTLGVTPPPTGIKPWHRLLKRVASRGGNPDFDVIKVRLRHDTKTNTANQEYGVIEWELLDDA